MKKNRKEIGSDIKSALESRDRLLSLIALWYNAEATPEQEAELVALGKIWLAADTDMTLEDAGLIKDLELIIGLDSAAIPPRLPDFEQEFISQIEALAKAQDRPASRWKIWSGISSVAAVIAIVVFSGVFSISTVDKHIDKADKSAGYLSMDKPNTPHEAANILVDTINRILPDLTTEGETRAYAPIKNSERRKGIIKRADYEAQIREQWNLLAAELDMMREEKREAIAAWHYADSISGGADWHISDQEGSLVAELRSVVMDILKDEDDNDN